MPQVFAETLFTPARYKTYYGGRGGAKSWNIARGLIALAYTSKRRILCCREFQTSIKDSVHRLLVDQIQQMGVEKHFSITRDEIRCPCTGSEFLFKGLRYNSQEIKSTEGIDVAWVEEAQMISNESWELLIPTVRVPDSEIWSSFNPLSEQDPTFVHRVVNARPGDIVRKVGWRDNPWFPTVLDMERRSMLATDPDAYEHIWEGSCRTISNAVIFQNRVSVETFEAPENTRFFFGKDFGFATDPDATVRCFVQDECLYIDYEEFGHGIEIDELPAVMDRIPLIRCWPIKADCSRPETISYLRRQGFNISAADKWPGSVEDGLAHLKAFKRIVVHERCKHVSQEFRLYSYKVDKQTGDVLPVIVDKHNHGIDALRYALDGYIRRSSTAGVFARLGAN